MGYKLLDLAPELLLAITSHLSTQEDHVAFSRTCLAIQSLYTEEDWKYTLLRRTTEDQSYTRSRHGRDTLLVSSGTLRTVLCVKLFTPNIHRFEKGRILSCRPKKPSQVNLLYLPSYMQRRPSEDDEQGNPGTSHLAVDLASIPHFSNEERCLTCYENAEELKDVYVYSEDLHNFTMPEKAPLLSHLNIMSLLATTIPVTELELKNEIEGDQFAEGEVEETHAEPSSFVVQNSVRTDDGSTVSDVVRAGAQ